MLHSSCIWRTKPLKLTEWYTKNIRALRTPTQKHDCFSFLTGIQHQDCRVLRPDTNQGEKCLHPNKCSYLICNWRGQHQNGSWNRELIHVKSSWIPWMHRIIVQSSQDLTFWTAAVNSFVSVLSWFSMALTLSTTRMICHMRSKKHT